MSFLDLFPGVDALRLLVREVNVALFNFALVAHDVDLIARLELWVALVIEDFREREHPFRLGADVDNDVSSGEFKHRTLDDAVFADRLFGFGCEGFKRGGEIFSGGAFVLVRGV